MKRLTAFLLSLAILLPLAGCGTAVDPGVGQNKIVLSTDKTKYGKGERIELTMNFSEVNKEQAVIAIVSADLPHGQQAPRQEQCEEYRWINDFGEIPFFMSAPEKDGLFDARVYASQDGAELAFVTFAVGSADAPEQSGQKERVEDGSRVTTAYFYPPKAIYMDIRVGGSSLEGGTYSYALLDGNYSYTLNPDGIFFHISAEMKTEYCPYGDGWAIDNDVFAYGQVPEEKLVYEMTAYLDTFYHDAENGGYSSRIAKYYVGSETVCFRSCYVYELVDDGFGAYKKFWVDAENGATLKYVERSAGKSGEITYEFEVTEYNLLGPVWTDRLRPDYAAVTKTLF